MSGMRIVNPVCRGSYALGSACRKCERCLKERTEMEKTRFISGSPLDRAATEYDAFLRGAQERFRESQDIHGAANEIAAKLNELNQRLGVDAMMVVAAQAMLIRVSVY